MPAAKKTKSADVRKPADRKELKAVIESHPITFILIHADWCGHCQTFKKNVWSKLEELPNKKNGLAAIHHDQLEGTEFADAKIRGYPSVIVVGKKDMAEFEDEDGQTNAIPSEEANDAEKMTSLVSAAEPSSLMGSFKNMKKNVDVIQAEANAAEANAAQANAETAEEEGEIQKSPELSENAKASRALKSTNNSGSRPSGTAPPLNVPNPSNDILDTQEASPSMEFEKADKKKGEAAPTVGGGGSLYHSLLAATRDVAPAAALVAAAVMMKRGGKKTRRRGPKRGSRKSRKSRGRR
jgi:hypothetical protein